MTDLAGLSSPDLDTLASALRAGVGDDAVSVDAAVLQRLSGDLSLTSADVADVVVRPSTTSDVQAVVDIVRDAGGTLVARGAGMSYTRAHTPQGPGVVLVDMRAMTAVRRVSVRDRYVVVEPGCTWEDLYLELAQHGLRTPYWGPLSGRQATVGGTLSQNSIFYGSAAHGTAADSVIGVEVVLADGSVARTGSWAKEGGEPFSRHFGPDLSGLFVSDAGALGLKTAACLRTVATPRHTRAVDLPCPDQRSAAALMEAVCALGVASDVFAFDPLYHELLESLGFSEARSTPWSVHVVVEGDDLAHVEDGIARARSLAPITSSRRTDGSVALALRTDPFRATQMLFSNAPKDVHLPLHSVVPFSKVDEAIQVIDDFHAEVDVELREHDIKTWQLMTASASTIVLEPSFYFAGDYRDPTVAPEARACAVALRRELTARLDAIGGVHMQVGKYYPYLPELVDGSRELLTAIKTALDPQGILNPGALGL